MAFQLVDDVLDFTARENVLGKPVGSDLREGKVTLPLIYALERGSAEERKLVATVLEDRSYERVPFESILEMIEKTRRRRARSRARPGVHRKGAGHDRRISGIAVSARVVCRYRVGDGAGPLGARTAPFGRGSVSGRGTEPPVSERSCHRLPAVR